MVGEANPTIPSNLDPLNKLRKFGVVVSGEAELGRAARVSFEPNITFMCKLDMQGSIGAYTYIRPGRIGLGVRSIGRYCSIGPGISVGDGAHPVDWLSTSPFQYGGSSMKRWLPDDFEATEFRPAKPNRMTIGNDVWIGANVAIMPGVHIGNGAVIGAGSIVTKDVEPYTINIGNPARPYRDRFSDSIKSRIENVQWWKYKVDDLSGLTFDNPEGALDELSERIEAGIILPAQFPTLSVSGKSQAPKIKAKSSS